MFIISRLLRSPRLFPNLGNLDRFTATSASLKAPVSVALCKTSDFRFQSLGSPSVLAPTHLRACFMVCLTAVEQRSNEARRKLEQSSEKV